MIIDTEKKEVSIVGIVPKSLRVCRPGTTFGPWMIVENDKVLKLSFLGKRKHFKEFLSQLVKDLLD